MDINQDSQEALLEHGNLIRQKKFLNKIYIEFYHLFKNTSVPKGPIIELGSGAGFIKEIMPNVITSDVIKGPGIDKVFSATKLPFKNSSVAAFIMIDVLHHIKDSEKALTEMLRTLKPNGKIIMIEPYNSAFGGLIYSTIHPERKNYKPNSGWKIKGRGRMSDSNPTLPWIIFVRDRKIFEKKFPQYKIIQVTPHTPFKYLISGGLTKVQFLPTSLYSLVNSFEQKLAPLNKFLGLFVTIELQKISSK